MKIKISIPGKTTVEAPILKNTQFALLKGDELHINPDGYEGEVKIITLKEDPLKHAFGSFHDLHSYPWIPPGVFGICDTSPFGPRFVFNKIFP